MSIFGGLAMGLGKGLAANQELAREQEEKQETDRRAAAKQLREDTLLEMRRSGAIKFISDPRIEALVRSQTLTSEQGVTMQVQQTTAANKPNKREIIKGADGLNYYPDTQELVLPNVATPAPKPQSTPGMVNADYDAGLIDEATRDAQILKLLQTEGMEIKSDGKGGFSMKQGSGVGQSTGDMNATEGKANIFATRMEKVSKILSDTEMQGTDFWKSIVAGMPLGNFGLSDEYRQYDQAKRDFINAVLRQESGAVIADSEFANAEKQYFPQPGDDPDTISQKSRNRKTATETIRQASGQPSSSEGEWTDVGNGVRIKQVK